MRCSPNRYQIFTALKRLQTTLKTPTSFALLLSRYAENPPASSVASRMAAGFSRLRHKRESLPPSIQAAHNSLVSAIGVTSFGSTRIDETPETLSSRFPAKSSGKWDVREDVVIRPGFRYAMVKVTNGTMTAHKAYGVGPRKRSTKGSPFCPACLGLAHARPY